MWRISIHPSIYSPIYLFICCCSGIRFMCAVVVAGSLFQALLHVEESSANFLSSPFTNDSYLPSSRLPQISHALSPSDRSPDTYSRTFRVDMSIHSRKHSGRGKHRRTLNKTRKLQVRPMREQAHCSALLHISEFDRTAGDPTKVRSVICGGRPTFARNTRIHSSMTTTTFLEL